MVPVHAVPECDLNINNNTQNKHFSTPGPETYVGLCPNLAVRR